MTDCEFLLSVLADGEPHCLNEILRRSFDERGCGLTVHSRASDLRKLGHRVSHWTDGQRGNGSWYSLEQATALPLTSAAVASSSEHVFPGDERPGAQAGTATQVPDYERPLAETGVTKAAAKPHHAPVSASEQLVLTGAPFRRTAA